jgi:cytochrome c peroxidase
MRSNGRSVRVAQLLIVTIGGILLSFAGFRSFAAGGPGVIRNLTRYTDTTGTVSTYNINGSISLSNAFFQNLGTNGRNCATCHVVSEGFGLSAVGAQARYTSSSGTDPLFAPVDGANCPNGVPGNSADNSLILNKGLIRFSIPIPANAQFTITVVSDPYGCALTTNPVTGVNSVSVYRRPLPSTNLSFLSSVMFDGRETLQPLNNAQTFAANLANDLTQQAIDAVQIHEQATTAPTGVQTSAIVSLEQGLFTAQVGDNVAGSLSASGALGGPLLVSSQNYYPGINDSFGGDPNGVAFNSSVFGLYVPWLNVPNGRVRTQRATIIAGETIFNTSPLVITNVNGINNNAALESPISFEGTCTTCHDTPEVGNHSFDLPLDIGTSHDPTAETDPNISAGLSQLGGASLPVYFISGCPNPFNSAEPMSFYTSDPAKALITGQCSDFNAGKVPILRGLAARAPYFHNGAAANLSQLVSFYNERFQMNLTATQQADLVAFLNTL